MLPWPSAILRYAARTGVPSADQLPGASSFDISYRRFSSQIFQFLPHQLGACVLLNVFKVDEFYPFLRDEKAESVHIPIHKFQFVEFRWSSFAGAQILEGSRASLRFSPVRSP